MGTEKLSPTVRIMGVVLTVMVGASSSMSVILMVMFASAERVGEPLSVTLARRMTDWYFS